MHARLRYAGAVQDTLPNPLKLARTLGTRWILYRTAYAARRRLGLLRLRMPARPWKARPLRSWLRRPVPDQPQDYLAWRKRNAGRFFFDAEEMGHAELRRLAAGALPVAERILNGRWPFFQLQEVDAGFPPDWHRDPLSGHRVAADSHWTELSDRGPADIKLIWDSPDQIWSAEIFVENVEDDDVYHNLLVGSSAIGSPALAQYAAPRTYGFRVGYRY